MSISSSLGLRSGSGGACIWGDVMGRASCPRGGLPQSEGRNAGWPERTRFYCRSWRPAGPPRTLVERLSSRAKGEGSCQGRQDSSPWLGMTVAGTDDTGFSRLTGSSMLSEFLQFLFSGLTVGATYALAALGFTIVYNASNVINFA